ncbi:MAG TPA: hypothetical protein VKB36_15850 [Vicinamibacterales bacterium]|nr:hypothetical protein [Vicinamibacterales bacterium]
MPFTVFELAHTNSAGWPPHAGSTRDSNALIDLPGDLIRATFLLIMAPRKLTSSPGQLIATARKVIAAPSDLIRATASLIT